MTKGTKMAVESPFRVDLRMGILMDSLRQFYLSFCDSVSKLKPVLPVCAASLPGGSVS